MPSLSGGNNAKEILSDKGPLFHAMYNAAKQNTLGVDRPIQELIEEILHLNNDIVDYETLRKQKPLKVLTLYGPDTEQKRTVVKNITTHLLGENVREDPAANEGKKNVEKLFHIDLQKDLDEFNVIETIQIGEQKTAELSLMSLPILSEELRKIRYHTLQQTNPTKINKFTNKHPGLRVFYVDNFTSASPKIQSVFFGLLKGEPLYVNYNNQTHVVNLNNSIVMIGVHAESLEIDNKTIGFHQTADQKKHIFGKHKHFAKHSIDFTISEQEKRERALSNLLKNEISDLIITHYKGIKKVELGEALLENFTRNYMKLSDQQKNLLKISFHEEVGAILKNNKNLKEASEQPQEILLEQDPQKKSIQVSLLRDQETNELPDSQE